MSAARNSGIEKAATPWLAFVDDDDLWAPNKLRSQLDALAAHASAQWSCTGVVIIDGQCRPSWWVETPVDADVGNLLLCQNVIPGGGSGVVASRDLTRAVGGFDEALSNLADWDFYIRLGLRSPVAAVSHPSLGYYMHPQGMAHDVRRSELEYRYLEVKYGAHRKERQVALNHQLWLSYLAEMAYRSGDRRAGIRTSVELVGRYRQWRSLLSAALGLAPERVRATRARLRAVPSPRDGPTRRRRGWRRTRAGGSTEGACTCAGREPTEIYACKGSGGASQQVRSTAEPRGFRCLLLRKVRTMRRTTMLRAAVLTAAAATIAATGGAAGTVSAASASTPSSGAAACAGTDVPAASAARVRDNAAKGVQEPKLYPDNEANAYGVIKDSPRMPNGSVTIPTVFHVVSDHTLSAAERSRQETMIGNQMQVLNDSYAGNTAPGAANSPFRFRLSKITWTVNPAWYTVVPGKNERDMKKALYEGDSTTLNVYSANIGGGLLGWSYFPKGYNAGRDYIDGVVMLDESMPGGTAGKYAAGRHPDPRGRPLADAGAHLQGRLLGLR